MNKITFLIPAILFFVLSCDPDFFEDGCHSHINLSNNSSMNICTGAVFSHPDTTIQDINPLRRGQKVKAGTTGRANGIGAAGTCIEDIFAYLHSEFISIFIFNAAFMEQHLNDENFRINENMALQRYDLTVEDLNILNWTRFPIPPMSA